MAVGYFYACECFQFSDCVPLFEFYADGGGGEGRVYGVRVLSIGVRK